MSSSRSRALAIWTSLPNSQLADIVWREFLDALRDRRTMAAEGHPGERHANASLAVK